MTLHVLLTFAVYQRNSLVIVMCYSFLSICERNNNDTVYKNETIRKLASYYSSRIRESYFIYLFLLTAKIVLVKLLQHHFDYKEYVSCLFPLCLSILFVYLITFFRHHYTQFLLF